MKKILFLTGTRADFGKLKPLIKSVHNHPSFSYRIFCTGMHMLKRYGGTILEIERSGLGPIFPFINQTEGESMEMILSNTIAGLSRYIDENPVEMVVIHGDRVEALAGAITGALKNILVAHIEGGEISGTIDELIRHSTSKMAHAHFVASETAKRRLLQLGEDPTTVFRIGSPDVDVMLSSDLPALELAKAHYDVRFEKYAIAILHPVTTELAFQEEHASVFVEALIRSSSNHILVYPNNDKGSEYIFDAYKKLEGNPRFRIFPSIRFEYFLSLLKGAEYIIGNSSAGIHEAPVFGVPTINIGSRQHQRLVYESILNCDFSISAILATIAKAISVRRFKGTQHYGDGTSAKAFVETIEADNFWNIPLQKKFLEQ